MLAGWRDLPSREPEGPHDVSGRNDGGARRWVDPQVEGSPVP